MLAWSVRLSIRVPLLLLLLGEFAVLYVSPYVARTVSPLTSDRATLSLQILDPRSIAISLVVLTCLAATGLYNYHQRMFFSEVLTRVGVGVIFGFSVLVVLGQITSVPILPARTLLLCGIWSLVALIALRLIFYRSVDENVFRFRTLVYGAGIRAQAISDLKRRADRRGFRIVGSILAPGDSPQDPDTDLLSPEKSILSYATELGANEIVVAMDDRRGNLPIRDLLDCRMHGISVVDLIAFLERESGKIRVDLVNPSWLIFSAGFDLSRFRQAIKRAMDILASVVLLGLSWPVMLVVVVAIKIGDGVGAPVFYRQCRIGFNGRPFNILKFRSMRIDAESDGKAIWASQNDSRITSVGNVLRKYRLDELPQIFNVLMGQMSIVGPRPERPEFVEELSRTIPYYPARHSVKPGVTGWAQLRYAYGSSHEDAVQKLHYDLYYVKNHGLLLDLLIILQTVEVVIWGKGAR